MTRRDEPDIQVQDEIEQLELLLAQLMSTDITNTEENNQLMARICKIQSRLNELRKKM
jgi:hypothetical protein